MGINIKFYFNNPKKVVNKIFDDNTMKFIQTEFYNLITPFTPFRDGGLKDNINITPEFIHYKSLYSRKIYFGKNMKFNKDKHPLATAEWDKVAMVSQKQKLINSIENYLKRGA